MSWATGRDEPAPIVLPSAADLRFQFPSVSSTSGRARRHDPYRCLSGKQRKETTQCGTDGCCDSGEAGKGLLNGPVKIYTVPPGEELRQHCAA